MPRSTTNERAIRLALTYTGSRVPPFEAVQRVAALGIGATALWVDLETGPEPLVPALDRALELGVAVLGLNAYANLVHPDVIRRHWNVERVRDAMAMAAAHGCCWVNTMAGTRDPALAFWAYHPGNFGAAAWDDLLESVRQVLDGAPEGVRLTLEPYMVTPLHTVRALRRVADEIGSPQLGVALDPVNLIGPREYHDSAGALRSMLHLLSDCVVAVQAKDHFMHRLKATIQIDERVPGQGELPYDVLLTAMAALDPPPALIIEHLHDDVQVASARDFIRRTAAAVGVRIV